MAWLTWIISNVVLASLLAIGAWFAQRRLRSHSLARVLWILVLVKLVTPPVVSVPLVNLPSAMACTLRACNCEHHAGTQDILLAVLLAAWFVGATAKAWNASRHWRALRQLTANARAAPAEWQTLAAKLCAELSMRVPQVLIVPGRLSPLVIPGWRPRVLVPADLMARLEKSQRTALLLHELVHIRRGDHWVRMLELAVGVAFWWLPAIGSIGRQLRACEEISCDERVVSHLPHARRDYARLLLDVVDFAEPLPQAIAMSACDDLKQRLHTILDSSNAKRGWPAALAVGLACAVLPCQLHYDFVRPEVRDVISADCEPPVKATISRSSDSTPEPLAVFCCPP